MNRKYNWAVGLLLLFFLQGFLWGGCGRMNFPGRGNKSESMGPPTEENVPTDFYAGEPAGTAGQADSLLDADNGEMVILADTVAVTAEHPDSLPLIDSLSFRPDSLLADSLAADTMALDSLGRRDYGKPFLDDIIKGHNKDSLVYDVRNNKIFIYTEGEVEYQDKVLKNADYMVVDMETKLIDAYGMPDSTGLPTRPIFVDGEKEYTMDSINYNLNSAKAKIKGVWTTEGEGILRGVVVKKMPDNTINIAHGKYSTCDADHPHFYIEMNRAKVIPGQKAVFGYSYFVMEDVPLPFLMLPFGFFPLNNERSSGFIIPSFGEEATRGFFLRDGGYYYAPNDYIDMTLLGGIYTLGSWEAKLNTRYKVRYRFNGGLNFQFNNTKYGDKGSSDYANDQTFKLQWTHSQDPKFKPGSTFSASVNFSSTQSGRHTATNSQDHITNQTTSSISYQKNWAGTPFSMAASFSHSQVNRDTTYSFTLPNLSFNMSRVNPFKFKNRAPGPERWYEKVALTYSGALTNSVTNIKEYDLLKQKMFDEMNTNMTHSIPVSMNFSLFNYINVSPSFSYAETWNTKKYERSWDEETQQVRTDTVQGFHRTYRYSGSVSANTTIYGLYDNFKPTSKIQALRHVMTPSLSLSYTPGIGGRFYTPYQSDASGTINDNYSPYSHMSPPSRNTAASLSFSLSQKLEAKVRSDQDSTGLKKISIIDELNFSFSYNFMADSMKLSRTVPVTLRSTLIPGFNINLSTQWGLYEVDRNGAAYDELLWKNGKFPRLESVGTSFNWSKSFGKGDPNARNTGTNMAEYSQAMNDPYNPLNMTQDEAQQQMAQQDPVATAVAYRNLLISQYYDFNVPLNVNFGYNVNYTNNGVKKTITQTTNFGFSANLTPKWGLSVSSGYDLQAKKLSHTTVNLTRDLHCWQMTFNWVPLGAMKSWNFHISIKANVLRDLKYEKSGSRYDEQYRYMR